MKDDIKPGIKVRDRYDHTSTGTVTAVNFIDDLADVQWSDGVQTDIDLDDLVAYDAEAEKIMATSIQAKVDEAKSAFEVAFAKWEDAQDLAADNDFEISDLKYMKLINM